MNEEVQLTEEYIYIKHECSTCGGTGLVAKFGTQSKPAIVCIGCGGKGWRESAFKRFTGRKKGEGVTRVETSLGDVVSYSVFEETIPVGFNKSFWG